MIKTIILLAPMLLLQYKSKEKNYYLHNNKLEVFMNKNMKRIVKGFAIVLLAVMVLGAVLPALAADAVIIDGEKKDDVKSPLLKNAISLKSTEGKPLANVRVDVGVGIIQKDNKSDYDYAYKTLVNETGKLVVLSSFTSDENGQIPLEDFISYRTSNIGNDEYKILVKNEDLVGKTRELSLEELSSILKAKGLINDDLDIMTGFIISPAEEDLKKIDDIDYEAMAKKTRMQVLVPYKEKDEIYSQPSSIEIDFAYPSVKAIGQVDIEVETVYLDKDLKEVPVKAPNYILAKNGDLSAGYTETEEIIARGEIDDKGLVKFSIKANMLNFIEESDKAEVESDIYLRQTTTDQGLTPHDIGISISGIFGPDKMVVDNNPDYSMTYELDDKGELAKIKVKVINKLEKVQEEPVNKIDIERLAGSSREETAIEVSKHMFDKGADTVIIASGLNTADALAAGPLSVEEWAPILLVTGKVSKELKADIERLDPEKIIIVGGQSSVSSDQEQELRVNDAKFIRLAGDDRFATSVEIAKYLNYDKLVLAEGFRSVDALSVSGYAANNKMAILLSKTEALPKVVEEYIENSGISHVEIVGGGSAVSKKIEKELGDKFVYRIEGSDRYATAVEIAKATYLLEDTPARVLLVNSSKGLVDALSAAPLSFSSGSPIIFTENTKLHPTSKDYILEKRVKFFTIIGGKASVGHSVEDEIKKLYEKDQRKVNGTELIEVNK